MASPIAEAFVRISPNLAKFKEDLLRGIKDALPKEGVPVRVAPTLVGFKTSLERQIAEKKIFAPVPITPIGLTKFREAIQLELAAKPVEVPVVPILAPGTKLPTVSLTGEVTAAAAAAAPAAGATGAAGTAALGPALEGVTAATDAVTAAVEAMTVALAKTGSEAIATGKIIRELAVLEDRLTQATGTATAAVGDATAANAAYRQSIKLAEQAIAVNAAVQETANDTLKAQSKALLETALANRTAREQEVTSTHAANQATTTTIELTKTEEDQLVALREAIKANTLAEGKYADALKVTSASTNQSTIASAELRAANTALAKANSARDAELKVGTLSENVRNVAIAEQIDLSKLSTKATVDRAAALQLEKAEALKATEAEAARSKELATGLRGGGATGLAAFGLRGATLAASAPFLAGAASATVILKSASAAAQFLKQLFILQDVSGATNQQLKDLSATAIQLGKDLQLPEVSAQDAAVALTDLVQSGFNVKQALQAVRGALLLGAAAQIDTATATDITVRTLDAFHLKAAQATNVVNDLVNAATNAPGTVSDFSAALAQSGAVAARSGLSLKNVTAILEVFAKGGFIGAGAGTALRQALVRLENPTNATAGVLKALNIQLRDANGNIKPDFLERFAKATELLPPSLRDTVVAAALGARAVKAFDIAAIGGEASLRTANKTLLNNSAAQKLAEAQTQGLAGHLKELEKNANTVGVQFGEVLTPSLTGLTEVIGGVLHGLAGFGQGISFALKLLSPFSGAFSELAKAIGTVLLPAGAFLAISKVSSIVLGTNSAIAKAYRVELARLTKANVEAGVSEEEKSVATQNAAKATLELDTATAEEIAALKARAEASAVATTATEADTLALGENAAAGAIDAVASEAVAGSAVAASEGVGVLTATRAGLGTLAGGITSLINPFTATIALVIATKIALDKWGNTESDVKKATDELTASTKRLNSAFTAQNIILERKALEDLAKAETKAATARFSRIGRLGTAEVAPQVAARAPAAAAAALVADLRKQAKDAQDVGDNLLAHNRNLLADFVHLLGSSKLTNREIKIFADNKATKTSFDEVLQQLQSFGGKAARDALIVGQKAREEFNRGFNPNLGRNDPISNLFSGPQTVAGLTKSLNAALAVLKSAKGAISQGALDSTKQLVDELAAQGPAGEAALRQIGARLGKALADGLTDAEKSQIANANQAVADAISQEQTNLLNSVISAKTNLGSIASSLASSVGQILDARAAAAIAVLDKSALAKEITALQRSLDKTNVAGQRQQLVLAIGSATDEASRNTAIFALRQFDLQNKLTNDQKKLQSEKDHATKVAELRKAASTKNINDFAAEYAAHKITLQTFIKDINKLLADEGINFHNAGQGLGFAFKQAFQSQFNALILQAKELAAFLGIAPGGTTQTSTVDIAAGLKKDQQAVKTAEKNRDQLLKSIQGNQKNKGTNDILTEIHDVLSGKGGKPLKVVIVTPKRNTTKLVPGQGVPVPPAPAPANSARRSNTVRT